MKLTDKQTADALTEILYGLARSGGERRAIDVIFMIVNNHLMSEQFSDVDELLERIDLTKLTPVLMAAVLAITAAARDKLSNRAAFYERVRAIVEAERGTEGADRLLVGLE